MLAKLKPMIAIFAFSLVSQLSFADPAPNFPQTIPVQDQQWALKSVGGMGNTQVATYISPNNPNTKIVVQRIKLNVGKGVAPAAIVENEAAQLNRNGHKTTVNMLETRPYEAIATLKIESAPGKMREDIQRLVFNSNHNITIIMHYGVDGEMNPAMRGDMLKVLKNIDMPF